MRRFAPLLVVVACSAGSSRDAVTSHEPRVPQVAAPVHAVSIAKGVPHGGQIQTVAVTERGDAALTADSINGLRLWPALDGSRPPIPLAVPSHPEQLAIGHAGRDLLAVILDTAGGVTLIRVGLDGTVRTQAQLPGGPTYAEVAMLDDGLVARTVDHALEWYASDGTLRGRVEVAHGERVTDLASRRGRAAAVIATSEGTDLRWLSFGEKLRFDGTLRLPLTPRDNLLALAPTRRRIAFVDSHDAGVHVYDIDLLPIPVKGAHVSTNITHHTLGFVDDSRVAIVGHDISWWTQEQTAATDPWDTPSVKGSVALTATAASIGDDTVATPYHGSLALTRSMKTSYLGWSDIGNGVVQPIADHLVLTFNASRFAWLDNDLNLVRSLNLHDNRRPGDPWMYGTPIGPRHLLTQTHRDAKSVVELLDVDKRDAPVKIGEFAALERNEFSNGVLAIVDSGTLRRFRIDLETSAVEEITPPIRIAPLQVSALRAFDPAKADGIAAIVYGWDSDHAHYGSLTVYRQVGAKITKEKVRRFEGQIQGSDADGTMYVLASTKGGRELHVMRGSTIVRKAALTGHGTASVFNPDATLFASRENVDVVVHDATGKERWRKQMWGVSALTFTSDSKRLVAAAPGGYVALDAATGEQVSRECGWNFGLHDAAPEVAALGFAPVCEDPLVQ